MICALLQLGLFGVLMIRAGMPRLPTNHGPPMRFRAALLDQVSADLSGRKGFRGWSFAELLRFRATPRLLPCQGWRQRRFGCFCLEECADRFSFWTGLSFYVLSMVMGIFLDCPYPPVPSCWPYGQRSCPRCLVWHGWLPALSGTGDLSPWAVEAEAFARDQGGCSGLLLKC